MVEDANLQRTHFLVFVRGLSKRKMAILARWYGWHPPKGTGMGAYPSAALVEEAKGKPFFFGRRSFLAP